MAERAAVRRLREQLSEAWEINESLLGRIQELNEKIAFLENHRPYESDASALDADSMLSIDQSRQGARVFRWPKHKREHRERQKRVHASRVLGSSPSKDLAPRRSVVQSDTSSFLRPESPVRTIVSEQSNISLAQQPEDSIVDFSPSRSRSLIAHESDHEHISFSSPNKEEIVDAANQTIDHEESNSNDCSIDHKAVSTPPKASPRVPLYQSARVEKTNTAVRFTLRPESQPTTRRRVARIILPDDSTNATINQSGAISDSPARAKRQTFRI